MGEKLSITTLWKGQGNPSLVSMICNILDSASLVVDCKSWRLGRDSLSLLQFSDRDMSWHIWFMVYWSGFHLACRVFTSYCCLYSKLRSIIKYWKYTVFLFICMPSLQNQIKNGVYPATPLSWLFVLTFLLALILAGVDPSLGMIKYISTHMPG